MICVCQSVIWREAIMVAVYLLDPLGNISVPRDVHTWSPVS